MSSYRSLYFFVEGPDDERFVRNILKPELQESYDNIIIWMYATETNQKNKNFLQSIRSSGGTVCFLGDINSCPCVTEKKSRITAEYQFFLSTGSIFVVIQEIESWYTAGIKENQYENLHFKPVQNTDDLTKEMFNQKIPKKYQKSRVDFMIEILKEYSIETAKSKNRSFNYFCTKLAI